MGEVKVWEDMTNKMFDWIKYILNLKKKRAKNFSNKIHSIIRGDGAIVFSVIVQDWFSLYYADIFFFVCVCVCELVAQPWTSVKVMERLSGTFFWTCTFFVLNS